MRAVAFFVIALAALSSAARVHADQITDLGTFAGSGTDVLTGGDGHSGSSTVSASVDFQYDSTSHQLLINITNTTAQNQLIGNDDALTQLAFNLKSPLSLTNGSASGETATYSKQSNGNLVFTPSGSIASENSQWGGGPLAAVPSESAFTPLKADNYAVTSFTDSLLTTGLKSYTSFSGTGIGSGSNYGVVPAVSGPAASDNFIGNNPYTYGTIYIAFDVSAAVTASDLSSVYFVFGTADPPNAIVAASSVNPFISSPEPGSLTLLASCFAVCGLGGLRRGMARPKRVA
jgi:hypothetical protein